MRILPNGYYGRGDDLVRWLHTERVGVLICCELTDQDGSSFVVVILKLLGSRLNYVLHLSDLRSGFIEALLF